MTARLAPSGGTSDRTGGSPAAAIPAAADDAAGSDAERRHGEADLPGGDTPTSWAHVAALVTVLSTVLAVVVLAFAWPASRSAVHDVPIAVAGPATAVTQVTDRLEAARPGAF